MNLWQKITKFNSNKTEDKKQKQKTNLKTQKKTGGTEEKREA